MRKKSWNDYGVSEVVGTILILGITVTLFAVVLFWVYSIPTPSPDLKVDFQATMTPIYENGVWDGANITMRHNGGETLLYPHTQIYINIRRGNTVYRDICKTRGYMTYGQDNGRYYGLIDGNDINWNAGERWTYTNHSIQENDEVEVMIIDTLKSVLLWQRTLQGVAGLNPPIFIEKWADDEPSTPSREVPKTGLQFSLYAKVIDPDDDLDVESVYCIITAFYGSSDFKENPQKMRDNGTGGDQVANDSIFTFTASWLVPQDLTWDGSVVIFNATDMAGHKTTSRLTLRVEQGPGGASPKKPTPPSSGAPPNLIYNGLQGFNLFNATEWDGYGYAANETRTFKEGEEVVVVVASALLKNSRGTHNEFFLYDPFSDLPPEPVVYGIVKIPDIDTQASNIQAFQYFQYVNGYNVFIYRFELNNASSVGINYYTSPAHPPNYYFARYPLEITLWDDMYPMPNKFHTTDSINITSNSGYMLTYPKLETFKDSGFSTPSTSFNHTDVVYVRITMKTVDSTYYLGNVVIQDYIGGTQVWKAPLDGRYVNQPICPVTGACNAGTVAVQMHTGTISYRFALNLSLANQDPWVPGTQNYALRILSIRDADEEYTLALQSQLTIYAPAFALDIAIVNDDIENRAWGTHDLSYYFENINGWDRWSNPAVRVLSGSSPPNAWIRGAAIRYLDFDLDGDLDLAGSFEQDNNDAWVYLFRRDLDSNGNTIWTPFILQNTGNELVTAIATGSIDRDTAAEIVVGTDSGKVWYYKNDGSWTKIDVDISRTTAVNSIDVGDFDGDRDTDIAVAREASGQKQVTWYPNLDGNGKFTTTLQTDYWKAEAESTTFGSIVTGDYTYTHESDSQREQLREETRTFSAMYSNDTAYQEASCNPGTIDSGSYLNTKTQDDTNEVLIETDSGGGTKKGMQCTWPISVPAGTTHRFLVDTHMSAGSSPNDPLRFYYSTSAGNPLQNFMFSVSNTTDTDYYHTFSGLPAGTVYITVTDSQQSNGETTDSAYIDHMYIETYIPGGTRSVLEHYWRLERLPNRPGSTYTMYVRGYRVDTGSEGDDFNFFYSTTGQAGPYSAAITVSSATETTYSYALPTSVAGAEVWIRVLDADRTNGKLQLADLYVNLLNITVQTPAGITGVDINLGSDASDGTALDAGNQNDDGNPTTLEYDDLAVGTANGNLFKIMGSAGGLVPPSGTFASPGGSISGVKLADCYLTDAGLEIVGASGSSVYIYAASGSTGTLRKTLNSPNSETIRALGAGDVDSDGDDDVVITTGGTNIGRIVYFRNNNGNWVYPSPPQFILGVPIWGIDLGDVSNSAHRGR